MKTDSRIVYRVKYAEKSTALSWLVERWKEHSAVQEVGFFSFFRAIAKFSVLEIISQLWFSLIEVDFL